MIQQNFKHQIRKKNLGRTWAKNPGEGPGGYQDFKKGLIGWAYRRVNRFYFLP